MSVLTRKLILPGCYYITDKSMILETLVGSCVSVCLYSKGGHISAMNHFINDICTNGRIHNPGKYGSESMQIIIDALLKAGINSRAIRAQVFGGANVLQRSGGAYEIGRANLDIAYDFLSRYGINVDYEAVGGTRGRRVRFNTDTFTAEHRYTGDIPRKKKS